MKAKIILYFLVTSLLLYSCLNKHENDVKISENRNQDLKILPDTLDIYSFDNKLNKIQILCNNKQLIDNLGEPDTIIKNRVLFIHAKKERIYIDQLNYWNLGIIYSSYNDKVRLQSIDLKTSKARLIHEKIVLDENTSLNTIEKLYPNSFSFKSKFPTDYFFGDSIIKSQKLLNKEIYGVPFFSGESEDDLIMLYFIDNKLRIIEIDGFFDL